MENLWNFLIRNAFTWVSNSLEKVAENLAARSVGCGPKSAIVKDRGRKA